MNPATNNTLAELLNDPYLLRLVAAALTFVVAHFAISSTPLRGLLVRAMGERPYLVAYSVVQALALWWLIASYIQAPYYFLWNASQGGEGFALVLMAPATLLLVLGNTSRNPTLLPLMKGGGFNAQVQAVGVLRITRHPNLSGYTLWAIAHILAKGELSALLFFGAFALLSIGGTITIDRRRRAAHGAAWDAFAAQTSRLPFGAIMAGRNHLALKELRLWRLGLAVAIYALFVLAHEAVIGVAAY